MSNRNLIDLAALSDPTDTHSLEELRAHLEDGGDMEAVSAEELDVRPVPRVASQRRRGEVTVLMNTKHTPTRSTKARESTTLPLRLPPELAERLRRLARAHDRSLNGELVWALRAYVEREEKGENDGE